MSRKKIIVIGAGVSGLASAVRLLNEGFEVELYEKNPEVGGRMGVISGNGFSFDLGPTILMMPQIYNEVFSSCGRNPADYIQMERLDPIYKVYFGDGTTHEASSELSSLIKTLESVSETETQGYLAYLADVYQRYLVAKEHFIERSFRTATDFYNPKTLLAGPWRWKNCFWKWAANYFLMRQSSRLILTAKWFVVSLLMVSRKAPMGWSVRLIFLTP